MADVADVGDEECSYEHACARAELLGMPPPDRDTFMATTSNSVRRSANDDPDELERQQVEQEEHSTKLLETLDDQKEELKNVSGGLEELTNILSITQVKLNRFKTVCGSLKNLFSLRGKDLEEECHSDDEVIRKKEPANNCDSDSRGEAAFGKHTSNKQGAGNGEVTSQLDKLDSLISKAENAELSMRSQNKQMRSYLR